MQSALPPFDSDQHFSLNPTKIELSAKSAPSPCGYGNICDLPAHPFRIKPHLYIVRFECALQRINTVFTASRFISHSKGAGVTLPRVEIDRIEVSTYTVPTDLPESDGTLEWHSTTLVLVRAHGGNERGLGYTYADTATATLIQDLVSQVVKGLDVMAPASSWNAMVSRTRNLGRPGVVSMAISAVDIALWDLKARLLNLPLITLLGAVRESVPIYGSGGFTSYSDEQLQKQFAGWIEQGITRVKMKIGRDAAADVKRVGTARAAIGQSTELFVDALTQTNSVAFKPEFRCGRRPPCGR